MPLCLFPPPALRSLRQASVAYSGGSPIGDDEYTLARLTVSSLDGEPLKETAIALTPGGREDDAIVVRIPGPPPDSTSDELAGYYARVRRRLEHGVHVSERGFFRLKGAADDPVPIGGDVLLTRASRQRYKIPVYNLTTGLNFSLYVERPRLEHLYNVKRTWLTISQLQRESRHLVLIPHLQWFRKGELKRQVRLLKEGGFHTITVNLQTMREKWMWERILRGMETVKGVYPEVRPIFTGVGSLKTMARLRQIFPWCCLCNSVCQYLAHRHARLRREGMRLVRETMTGNPSVVMSHSIEVYKRFLQKLADQHVERYGYGH